MPVIQTFPLDIQNPFITVEDKSIFYLISLHAAPDNRQTPEFLRAYLDALIYLRTIKNDDPKPLVTTSTIAKFFSNGLDLDRALATDHFFNDCLFPVYRALLAFPWPTIALVNGHAFAGGFILAAYHDYRIMNPSKGFLCMNELLFGANLPDPMLSIFRAKFGHARCQEIFLTAKRYPGAEALKLGLVDGLGGLEEAEALAAKVREFASKPTYGTIRETIYRDVLNDTRSHIDNTAKLDQIIHEDELYYDQQEKRLRQLGPKL